MERSKPTLYKCIDTSLANVNKPVKSKTEQFTPSVPLKGNDFFGILDLKTENFLLLNSHHFIWKKIDSFSFISIITLGFTYFLQ